MNFIKKHKFIMIAALIVAVLLGIASYIVHNPPKVLIQFMIEKALAINNNEMTFQDDALYVITTGTGGPLPKKIGSALRRLSLQEIKFWSLIQVPEAP